MGEHAAADASEAGHTLHSQDTPMEGAKDTDGGQPNNKQALDRVSVTVDSVTTNGNGAPHNSKKRSPVENLDSPPLDTRASGQGVKRVRLNGHDGSRPSELVPDKSLLPPEIWHHIFTFCPPRSLGNLLRVNKLFNTYLDASSSLHRKVPLSVSPSSLSPLKPGVIWQASRRLFWPQMPAPLRSMDELDMWRLICTPRCQNCQKTVPNASWALSPPQPPSPGPDGIAIIWAFAMRLCVACLLQKSIKELDLLVSPSIPSAILPALPFIFLTRSLHVLPTATPDQDSPPSDVQITKLFLRSDVDLLERHFSEVKDMGSGTVDEWLKGLSGQGKDLRQQALKWEKWAASGGVAKIMTLLYPGWQERSQGPQSPGLSASSTAQPPVATEPTPLPTTLPLPPPPQKRSDRSAEKIAELRASRKAEIERRALQLDPPLAPNVLRHIPAFQAAMQIITSLDDLAWEVLKPRLLAQRHDAEVQESSVLAEAGKPTEGIPESNNASAKETRELIDKHWEEVQAPLRAKIAGYADEIIGDSWQKGKKVTKGTCARFAVDVLVNVRKRFYAEVAKAAKAARAAGQSPPVDPPAGPFTQKLTLENMRWLFNTKVKPHTDPYRKDMFYCTGCEGGTHKVFGFEGVIQHYASKHTSSLSLGSMVVHWRAEWPEHPPFAAEANPIERLVHGFPLAPLSTAPVPPMAHYSQPFPPAPMSAPAYPLSQAFGAPQQGDFHHHPPALAYQHPLPFSPLPLATGYPQPGPYPPPQGPFQQYQTAPGPYATDPVDLTAIYGPSQGGTQPPPYASFPPNPPTVPAFPMMGLAAHPNGHQAKLEDIARNARAVWQSLGNIKDLPGSARVFTTIHHVVKRYRVRFHETPPLAMFNDGLANMKAMRPVRNINNLVCKACHLRLDSSIPEEQDRKSFSLPQLTNHFLTKHVEPRQSRNLEPLDWIVDMVLLPDQASIPNLPSSLNDFERSLVADALPELFGPQATRSRRPPGAQDSSTPAAGAEQKHQPHSLPPRPPAPATLPKKPIVVAERTHDSVANLLKPSPASNGQLDRNPAENDNGRPSSANNQPKRDRKAHRGARGERNHNKGGRQSLQSAGIPHHTDPGRDDHSLVGVRPGDQESGDGRAIHEPQPSYRNPSPRWMPPQDEEPHVMSALEKQLGMGQAPGPQHPPSGFHYADGRGDTMEMENHPVSRLAYSRYGPDVDAYRQVPPARDSPPRQTRQSYGPRPSPYGDYQPPVEEVIPPPRFAPDRRYDGVPAPRPDDEGRYAPDRRQPEPYRYPEDRTVEAYEIVQVIEGDREYYIRRPVRREQSEVRYTTQARQGWQEHQPAEEGGGYYAAAPPPQPREVQYRREQQQPRTQEGGGRYYEEVFIHGLFVERGRSWWV
ncbi:hypothetical protein QBC39DRAFT_7066 [Podospora conica]|nr:hypothetical protein QBC39DRAFT_7066 [Schizothecium conicum]